MKKLIYLLTFLFSQIQESWAMWEGEEEKTIPSITANLQQNKHKENNKRNLNEQFQKLSSEKKDAILFIPQNSLEFDQPPPRNEVRQTNTGNIAKVLGSVDILPVELLINISLFLEVNDLGKLPQLSKKWQVAASAPDLWKWVGLTKYGDYLSAEDLGEKPKQKVITHYLRILVNTKENLSEIEQFVDKHNLFSYLDFLCYKGNFYFSCFGNSDFFIYLINNSQDLKELCAQRNESACNKLIQEGALQEAIKLNEILIKRGNTKAIERKLKGLKEGGRKFERPIHKINWSDPYGLHDYNYSSIRNIEANNASYRYTRDYDALREFIEELVLKGNPEGIKEKIYGLNRGENGYGKDPVAAREFIETLVQKGDPEAIESKIWALADGGYGYEKDTAAARELNEIFVTKGDPRAIARKFEGLKFTRYGYQGNHQEAIAFNDALIEKGDQEAIERKIKELTGMTSVYTKKDLQLARELNEYLVSQNNHTAINRKIHDLLSKDFRTECAYEFDPQAAVNLNEKLILEGDLRAIFRKIVGTQRRDYGYERNSQCTKELVDTLSESDVSTIRGVGCYLKVFALKYGILGYTRNREEANNYILKFNVPF